MLESSLKPVQANAWLGKDVNYGPNAASKANNGLQNTG